MSEQRHDSGSITLTEEDLGVDATAENPAVSALEAGALSGPQSDSGETAEQKAKKVRRTVRIPDDEVQRPSRPPPAVAAPTAASPSGTPAAQPIMGQRIIAIGGASVAPPPATPKSVPPPRPPSVPPARMPSAPAHAELASSLPPARGAHPSIVDLGPPEAGSGSVPVARAQEDDSWTPYQPLVVPNPPESQRRPSSAPSAHAQVTAGLPASQRRPSVQFEAPPSWARPPGMRPPADSRPSIEEPRSSRASRPDFGSSPDLAPAPSPAPAGIVDLATPPPGQPWAPPRDSIVDVAVDFESDVTLLDLGAGQSERAVPVVPDADSEPIHARSTRLDESELEGGLPTGYVPEPEADLSSSHLEMEGPPSLEEVDIDAEPDSDARPSGEFATEDLTDLASDSMESVEPPPIAQVAPPPPPKVNEKSATDKGGPPAPRLPSPNLLTLGNLGNLAPMPLTDAASQRKKAKPWWEELFNDDFVRTAAKGAKEDYKSEVDFIEESLGMEKGAQILDLACGTGRHAIELSKRGYRMVGFDLSLAMLARAADLAQAEDQRINFVQGDMREMQFEEAFDGVYSWNTSFGYFEEDKNAQVAQLVHKALRKGGQFLLDIVNRDYIIQESPTVAWFEGDACICMDEMHIDWITSRMRVKRTIMFDDGRSRELEYSVRLYSLHELGRLLHEAGFRVTEVSGLLSTPGVFFGCQSPRTLILAEKR